MVNVSFHYEDSDPDFRVNLRDWSTNARQIMPRTIEAWICECIRELESHPELERHTVTSGDSLVIVERYDSEDSPYEVTVCTVRQSGWAHRK